jgi:hypothetical protein
MSCPIACFLTCANHTSGGEVVLLSKARGKVVHLGRPTPVFFTFPHLYLLPEIPSPKSLCFTFPHLRRWQHWSRWPEIGESITRRGSITTNMVGSVRWPTRSSSPPSSLAGKVKLDPPPSSTAGKVKLGPPPPQRPVGSSSVHPPPLAPGSIGLPRPGVPSWWRQLTLSPLMRIAMMSCCLPPPRDMK